MALTEFKALPDTSTPLNPKNLNGNFNELNDNLKSNLYKTNISTQSAGYTTHYMQLGYINVEAFTNNEKWGIATLLISHNFYYNQHYSSDIITIFWTQVVNAHRLKIVNIGGNFKFYFYKDETNKRIYIYAYVDGGNGFGYWNIKELSTQFGNFILDRKNNIEYNDSWTEI